MNSFFWWTGVVFWGTSAVFYVSIIADNVRWHMVRKYKKWPRFEI